MQLEHLCDLELTCRTEPIYGSKFALVQPYGGLEGHGYCELDGSVTGSKLQGIIRAVNHPHRRSDGAFLPDVRGVIRTEEGIVVMFSLQGQTTFAEKNQGKQLLTATFAAEDERYLWLNNIFCVLEGVIDPATAHTKARVYSCVNEFV
jgi:hypothetical protein